ncbi:atrial natriuretic peptide receptor 3-like [Gigantopelta aegis]|uniref:atrial natriuretic peptide receptor 3-like n=1 Tax=Gigantopelta aegis TaxID=1735272 RepID=UPI001B88CE02|nr:atrial natriuretic peptide receptor 3-like [Gigantopelta aegis]
MISWLLCILLLNFLCGSTGYPPHRPISIATLVPADERRLFSIKRVSPAIAIAIDKVTAKDGILPYSIINVKYRDSQCSIADAMNEAINYYVKKEADVLFGPCCDYAAAPIARQTRYWNLPMVTPGAMARDFAIRKKNMFPLLTRMGANFDSLVDFLVSMLNHFGWSKVNIVYHPDGQSYVVERFCHVATDGIHYGMRARKGLHNFTQDYFKFDYDSEIVEQMKEELGREFAGVREQFCDESMPKITNTHILHLT